MEKTFDDFLKDTIEYFNALVEFQNNSLLRTEKFNQEIGLDFESVLINFKELDFIEYDCSINKYKLNVKKLESVCKEKYPR